MRRSSVDRIRRTSFPSLGAFSVRARRVSRPSRPARTARTIGSYRVEERIGRGGMGEVYRATHCVLGRPVAIKLIRPEILGAGDRHALELSLRRFQHEAEVAAQLRSPHTVELYDFGITPDGTFYFVMELLNGLDMVSLVRRFGPVPAERVVHFLQQICRSLREMHARGLVHRDITPANIHVCRLGLEYDFVKVGDFGLTRSATGPTPECWTTADRTAQGTPAFITPEVALGRQVDERTDVYALGCVAYWLLTGRLVFRASTAKDMLALHARQAPVPPSHRTELAVPQCLDRLVLSCLEKRRDRRPANAHAVLRYLASCQVAKAWTEEQAERWWQRHLPAAT